MPATAATTSTMPAMNKVEIWFSSVTTPPTAEPLAVEAVETVSGLDVKPMPSSTSDQSSELALGARL